MGFLSSLFGRNNGNPVPVTENSPGHGMVPGNNGEVRGDCPVSGDNNYAVPYGTKMPIDAIYSYISANYEQQGYDDALCNTDSSYKDARILIITNELKRLFEQVGLRYRSDLRDIEVQIGIVEQQGLTNTAASLKARKETYMEHMTVIKDMKVALDRGEPQMLSMINSYERGFFKGLAAKSDSFLHHGSI